MQTKTILNRLIRQAESYGIDDARDRIVSKFEHDIPRCAKCGRPMVIVDMAGTDCFFAGCPNDAHHDGDIQI